MFRALVSLKQIHESVSFCETFRAFFTKIFEILQSGESSYQWLESANFIEYQTKESRRVMNFYQARDLAYEIGLLQGEGVLQESVSEPSPSTLEHAFVISTLENLADTVRSVG